MKASPQPAGRGHEPAYWSPLIGLLVGTAFTPSQTQRAPTRSHPEMEERAMARGGGQLGREVQDVWCGRTPCSTGVANGTQPLSPLSCKDIATTRRSMRRHQKNRRAKRSPSQRRQQYHRGRVTRARARDKSDLNHVSDRRRSLPEFTDALTELFMKLAVGSGSFSNENVQLIVKCPE